MARGAYVAAPETARAGNKAAAACVAALAMSLLAVGRSRLRRFRIWPSRTPTAPAAKVASAIAHKGVGVINCDELANAIATPMPIVASSAHS